MLNYILAFDIETSGSSYLHNGILSIGASLQDNNGKEHKFFEVNINLPREKVFEEKCKVNFWNKYPEALDYINSNTVEPNIGIQLFAKFLDEVDLHYPRLSIVSDNPSFDIAWLDYYLIKYSNRKPLRYSSTSDNYRMIWDYGSIQKIWLWLKTSSKSFYHFFNNSSICKLDSKELLSKNHKALDDARAIASNYRIVIQQLQLFKKYKLYDS